MTQPTLCMIHEAISKDNAIAKIALCDVEIALDAGWQVTVIAKVLDESLRERVEWLPLYVPSRLFLLKWATARQFMRRALGARTFDVVHAHQPQAATLADVFQCHYLTRVAYERGCLEGQRANVRGRLVRAQGQGVLYLEDYCYRQWNPRTRMLYASDLTRQDFHRLYGLLPLEGVLVCPCPPLNIPSEEERRQARQALVGKDYEGLVVGYLGGLHERKGYRRLVKAMQSTEGLFLMMGGQYCDGFTNPALNGRMRAVGLVSNTAAFYAACDVLVVPSHYEPLGLVAFEAAARGVPVIATPEVGALPHLMEYGVGAAWNPAESIEPVVRSLVRNREAVLAGARRMVSELGRQSYGEQLLATYETIMREKRGGYIAAAVSGNNEGADRSDHDKLPGLS